MSEVSTTPPNSLPLWTTLWTVISLLLVFKKPNARNEMPLLISALTLLIILPLLLILLPLHIKLTGHLIIRTKQRALVLSSLLSFQNLYKKFTALVVVSSRSTFTYLARNSKSSTTMLIKVMTIIIEACISSNILSIISNKPLVTTLLVSSWATSTLTLTNTTNILNKANSLQSIIDL